MNIIQEVVTMSLHQISVFPSLADSALSDRFSRIDKLFSQLTGDRQVASVPAYDLQRLDDARYALTVSVPGWKEHELEIELSGGRLSVAGKKETTASDGAEEAKDEKSGWIYRGIARHDFRLSFSIPEHMKVTGASLADGLLNVGLLQEIPESEKPRRIPIEVGGAPRTLEHQE
ncbi:Heat-shock protein [Pantoea brenneri]|uniref:Heat-shock protein n=2 Tax=Pantoea brenneri TaxID=472694 RepID=A0AAX3JBX2_9GAMM|nr:Heat-shock protein [Pantoea brenneri]